jgi:SAM-dependent methyltransferase
VLDAGCGTGRHALFLASRGCVVHAVDISGTACGILRDRIQFRGQVARRISVEQAALEADDLPDSQYDVILDSYVSCHMLTAEARLAYLRALRRQLRPGGVLYTTSMGAADAYYGPLARGRKLATDPLNGITKRLETPSEFRELLNTVGPIVDVTAERFVDQVAGSSHRRQVLAGVVRP